MTDKEKKSDKTEPININISIQKEIESPNNQETKLIGNKREREKVEPEETGCSKNCDFCKKSFTTDILELNKTMQNEIIIEAISKQIKDDKFLKILKKNSEKLKIVNNENINTNIIICYNCLMDNFITGGLVNIFSKPENDINCQDQLKNFDQKNNLNQILDIYSINFNLAINSLKQLKEKYSKVTEITYELFESKPIKNLLSNNKEDYQELKIKMNYCKQNLKEIGENFDNLIKKLSSEELKKLFTEKTSPNDNFYKNNFQKVLKMENEIKTSIDNATNNNGDIPSINNDDNDKKLGLSNEFYCNLAKNEKEKNDIYNKTTTQNNQLLYNIQNQKKQNINEQLLPNNLDKNILLSHNNYIQNNPIDPFINPILGLIPNIGLSQGGRTANNILLNNLSSSPILNPQILGQINNNNSIISNNSNNINNNDNRNGNINNLNNMNNISLNALNGYLQRPNYGLSLNDSSKEIDNILIRNIINNNSQNNLINNLYNSHINSNPLSPIGVNLFGITGLPLLSPSLACNINPAPAQLYSDLLNIQNNNSNLSQSINNNNIKNNNSIEQNKTNQLNNLINNERNLINVNNNANNKNLNMNNLNNINNTNDMNKINNINYLKNVNNINKLNGLNNLNNNLIRNDINNNLYLYQSQHQQQPINQNEKGRNLNPLLELFNEVAKMKQQKNLSFNNENNLNIKNNNISNINSQAEVNLNGNEQNITQQINSNSTDNKSSPLNIIKNNNKDNNIEKNDSLMPNNIKKDNEENKGVNNGNEQSKNKV